MSLLVTYPPHRDESGLGYYRRLAADNVLSGWRELASMAGIPRNASALLEQADLVAGVMGLEPGWAQQVRAQDVVRRGWGHLHRKQTDAVCPACLAEAPYLRHYWGHAYVTACAVHRIQLVDCCDGCGERLSPERGQIDQCECGQDLRELPRQSSTPSQQWLSSLMASAGTSTSRAEPKLKGVDLGVLAQVVATLCLAADPTRPMAPRVLAYPQSVSAAVAFLAPLELLLADWPRGFQDHVASRIAAGKPEARTLNTLLGQWYIRLRKLCLGTALEPFLQAIINVAAVQFDGLLGLDSAKAMAEAATDHLRASEAARAIGISEDRLLKAIQAGECLYRTRRMGTRGQIYEIPRDEVTRIQQRRAEWVSTDVAGTLAGVPPAVLEHMMAANVILADVNWRQDLLKGGPVASASLSALFDRIGTAAEPVTVGDEETLTWAGLTSRRMGDKQAIQTVMQAIADGRVKAIACGRRLGDMVFRRADVAMYFGTPLLEAGMSIQQLSKFTGWKWESIAYWIDEGLLESESILLRGRPCRVVLPHQLLMFRQTYVPLADLARGLGTKSSALSKLLPGIELVGARSLPDGTSRGGLIRIADLGRLAVIGARAGQDLFVSAYPAQ